MDLRQIQAFKKVALLQSYTKAAEALSLTQPAISHQLSLLEQDCGQQLFVSHGRKMHLTEAGEALLPYANRILSQLEEARRTMEQLGTGERGTVTVAAIGSSTIYILPDLLYRFGVAHPDIELHLRTESGEEIVDMVSSGKVDMGIVGSHISTAEFATVPLFKDRILPFVHGAHPFARKRRIKFLDLSQEPLIQLGNWRSWENYVFSMFRQVGREPHIRLHLDSIDAVKRMVERGLGFTIIPDTAAKEEAESGALVSLIPTDVTPMIRQILIIRKKNKEFSPAQKTFVDFLRKETRASHGVA